MWTNKLAFLAKQRFRNTNVLVFLWYTLVQKAEILLLTTLVLWFPNFHVLQ